MRYRKLAGAVFASFCIMSACIVSAGVVVRGEEFGGPSPPVGIPAVLISSFELSLSDWRHNNSAEINRDGIYFEMKDKASGYSFEFREDRNRVVFVSVEITSAFIDIMSVGSLASENGVPLYWTVVNGSMFLNITLSSMAHEVFRMKGFTAFKYELDYSYRSKFRSWLHGDSVRLDVKCEDDTPNVFVNITKTIDYYNRSVNITGRAVVVKYLVKHDFKYPINTNRKHPIWYEVRDIDTTTLQIVVHFTQGKSGDIVVIFNPVWYDYVTAVPLLDVCGWDVPVASLGVPEYNETTNETAR